MLTDTRLCILCLNGVYEDNRAYEQALMARGQIEAEL